MNLKDYLELHKYSVEDYTFWQDLWEYTGILSSVPPEKIITEGKYKEIPIWFPGARLNYAENVMYNGGDAIACTEVREIGTVTHYSFNQLRAMVADMAAALRVNGLQVGDRVAAVLTNCMTTVVLSLATISVGAIFSCTAPDMGEQGILDRYKQIKPKFLFSETEVVYSGKTIDVLAKIRGVAQKLSTEGLKQLVLLPSIKTGRDVVVDIPHSMSLSSFLATGDGRPLTFEQVEFRHPVYILYSSGTSGPPKCIVHSGGGVLLQAKKEGKFVFDMGIQDTYFQYTTAGWMMWNSMISSLGNGARNILYDGSPFYPNVRSFLKMVNDQGVTILGTGPRFLSEVKGQGLQPKDLFPFASLRTVFSTGSVLTAPMYEWAQEAFGERMHIMSASGGTDICSGFVTAASSLPIYAGEMPCKSLGMKVEIFDPDGKNIEDTGMPGELVCTRPHIGLPVSFWGDESGEKLRKAYFDMYPGVWRQADFMVKNPKTQGLIILGRSDGVLNPSGVRFGSAEIYAVLENYAHALEDSLVVGQRRPEDKDERVLLFLKMREGQAFTDELVTQIKKTIRESLSARHVPEYIFPIEDIPYTVNAKRIEIAVKQIVSGSNLKPSGTVANPSSLDLYYKFRHLERIVDDKGRLKPTAKL